MKVLCIGGGPARLYFALLMIDVLRVAALSDAAGLALQDALRCAGLR